MQLVAVEVLLFRNLRQVLVTPHPRMNVLAGPNGQGKTNFLEAIFLLGTLRAFRGGGLDELVSFGESQAYVRGRVSRGAVERLFEVGLRCGAVRQKRARIDGKAVRAAGDYFGGFNVVLFAPEDLRLVRGAPAERRRFLDRAVSNAMPQFLPEAQTYDRILRSRNALLREYLKGKSDGAELLSVFDEQLAAAGAALVRRRRRFLADLLPRVQAAHESITRSGLTLGLGYDSKLVSQDDELSAELLVALRAARRRDLERGFTGPGPHGDDLEIQLNGHPARFHASQGQVRAIILALKVAEIEHLTQVLGEPPILLLDDVSSELDPERTTYLFEFIGGLSCQAYLTTTMPGQLPLPPDRADFEVRSGEIRG
jgi:DNA replication and repair protein RecF